MLLAWGFCRLPEVMHSRPDSGAAESRSPISKHLAGPSSLRHYPGYELVTWQPKGTLDDALLDQIAEWLVNIEKVLLPFKRFIDLSQLTTMAVRSRHLFEFARKRAEEFSGIAPVRTALYCDDWVGFGIAEMYETLMEVTPIQARAFRDRAKAADWLGIPLTVLTLTDQPDPHNSKGR